MLTGVNDCTIQVSSLCTNLEEEDTITLCRVILIMNTWYSRQTLRPNVEVSSTYQRLYFSRCVWWKRDLERRRWLIQS